MTAFEVFQSNPSRRSCRVSISGYSNDQCHLSLVSCDPLFCVRYEVDEEKQLVCFNFLTLPGGLPVLTLHLGLGLFWHVNRYLDPLAET